jgi:hypothetical protein
MEHTYESTTVEMDHSGFNDLKNQILSKPEKTAPVKEEQVEKSVPVEKRQEQPSNIKRSSFHRGDQKVDIDDDYEIEIMADKRPTKLTLRELKERASGDIAVKNRMHSLAEEKKRVQSTFKEFAVLSMKDPIAALEFISQKATEADSSFAYDKYIEKLSEAAEKLGQMDEKDRKAWELEKKLQKAEQDLSQKNKEDAVVRKKQEILSIYPEIGDSEFGEMVDTVLNNEELLEGVENEDDVMEKVEELIVETLTQRDIITVINEINPAESNNNELIFALSDQLRQNPDLDEEDVRDILREILRPEKKSQNKAPVSSERQQDMRTLSSKARQGNSVQHIREQNAAPYDLLQQQLLERRKEISKTPLYKR